MSCRSATYNHLSFIKFPSKIVEKYSKYFNQSAWLATRFDNI